MAQLSKIVSSILRDMVLAQHQANMYAIKLAESYRKNGQTENFPLPAVALGEMELDIKYGIKDDTIHDEQYEIDYPKLRKKYAEISQKLAKVMVTSIVSTVMQSKIDDDINSENLIAKLYYDKGLQRKFSTFLSHKLLEELQIDGGAGIIKEDGTLKEDVIIDYAVKVGKNMVLYHEELENLFAVSCGEEVRQEAMKNLHAAVEVIIPQLLNQLNIKRKRLFPSLDVIISAQELARLPEESIHTFHFKIFPRDLSLSILSEDENK